LEGLEDLKCVIQILQSIKNGARWLVERQKS
jgi:hypothetical protein